MMLEESPIKEDIFFDRFTNKARAILVDSEPKVIKNIMDDRNISFVFDKSAQTFFTQNGRGNNWALGYSATYKENQDGVGVGLSVVKVHQVDEAEII